MIFVFLPPPPRPSDPVLFTCNKATVKKKKNLERTALESKNVRFISTLIPVQRCSPHISVPIGRWLTIFFKANGVKGVGDGRRASKIIYYYCVLRDDGSYAEGFECALWDVRQVASWSREKEGESASTSRYYTFLHFLLFFPNIFYNYTAAVDWTKQMPRLIE